MKKHKQRKIRNIIINHLEKNAKEYMILLLVFIIGIIIGIFFVNNMGDSQKSEIISYLDTFINTVKQNKQINYIGLLKDSAIKNTVFVCVLWILGITVTLAPLIYGVIGVRGFCLGYTISSIISTLGVEKGLMFSLTILFAQNIIVIPAMLAIAQSGIQVNKKVLKQSKDDRAIHRKDSIKFEIIRHTFFSILMLGVLLISSIIETYFSTNFFIQAINFIQN